MLVEMETPVEALKIDSAHEHDWPGTHTIRHTNREDWLMGLTELLKPMFTAHSYPIPEKLRIACGWPVGTRGSVLGQCWTRDVSDDLTTEIFITPRASDALTVSGILIHELTHAAVGVAEGHKGAFKRLATSLGMVGPMRHTLPGPDLSERLNALITQLGPYPHASLDGAVTYNPSISGIQSRSPVRRLGPHTQPGETVRKTQKTRLQKVICPCCGYTARITRRWLDVGLPMCPQGTRMAEASSLQAHL